jgi:hypothetical protein
MPLNCGVSATFIAVTGAGGGSSGFVPAQVQPASAAAATTTRQSLRMGVLSYGRNWVMAL